MCVCVGGGGRRGLTGQAGAGLHGPDCSIPQRQPVTVAIADSAHGARQPEAVQFRRLPTPAAMQIPHPLIQPGA